MSVVVDVQPGCIGDAGESERSAGQNGELYKPHPVGVFQPESPVVVALCCLADTADGEFFSVFGYLQFVEKRLVYNATQFGCRNFAVGNVAGSIIICAELKVVAEYVQTDMFQSVCRDYEISFAAIAFDGGFSYFRDIGLVKKDIVVASGREKDDACSRYGCQMLF